MAALAGMFVGAAGTVGGLLGGAIAGGVALIVGPHMANLVPYWVSIAVLAAAGCASWIAMNKMVESSSRSSSDGFTRVMGYCGALGVIIGYVAGSVLVLFAGFLLNSADKDLRRCAWVMPFVPLILAARLFFSIGPNAGH